MIGIHLFSAVTVVGMLAIFTSFVAAESTAPFIYAEFQPGGTCHDCFGWRVTILEDGTVTQEVKNVAGWGAPDEWSTRRTDQISKRRLARLRSAIQEVGFSSLRDEYSANYDLDDGSSRVVTDLHTVILAITLDGSVKRVSIYGPEMIAGLWHSEDPHPDRDAGKRILAMWAEIVSLMRTPNPWQKARVYR